MSSSTSFLVDDVELATSPLDEKPVAEIFGKLMGVHLEAHNNQHSSLIASETNAFVRTIHLAFDGHRPLVLSPDHIWLLLCQGFAHHVRINAEALRHKFVAHEGKLLLTASHPKLQRGTNNPWDEIIPQFSSKIRQHIGSEIHDTLTPQFSTTTAIETFTYEATLMNAMSAYFDYAVTRCGIPSITLEGSLEDWQLISQQVQKFRDYDFGWWVDVLEPILKEFVLAREVRENRDFWKNIYKLSDRSGGPFITGWIINFFPYLGEELNMKQNPVIQGARNHITLADIPNGLTSASVLCDDGSHEWDATIKSGFVGISQNQETLALRPEIGWAVRDETAIEEDRQTKRLAKRRMEQLTQTENCYISGIAFNFRNGAYQLSRNTNGQDSKEAQVNAATWAEIEHENLFYCYDSSSISNEDALELIQAHEKQLRYLEDGLIRYIFIH